MESTNFSIKISRLCYNQSIQTLVLGGLYIPFSFISFFFNFIYFHTYLVFLLPFIVFNSCLSFFKDLFSLNQITYNLVFFFFVKFFSNIKNFIIGAFAVYCYFIWLKVCPVLTWVVLPLLVNIFLLPFIKTQNNNKLLLLLSTVLSFMFSLYLLLNFNLYTSDFQFFYKLHIYSDLFFIPHFGIDSISLVFILLTAVIFPIVMYYNFTNKIFTKKFMFLFLVLQLFLYVCFSTLNLFIFFFFFECIVLPMFFIIIMWPGKSRKKYASLYFALYTLLGSIFIVFSLLYLKFQIGSLNFYTLSLSTLDFKTDLFLWFCFFLSFAVKIPMYPTHVWLPEAHVEAPTSGSVILASLLLKLGGYGFIRWSLPVFPLASDFFKSLICVLCLVSIFYSSLVTIRQVDLKKIIAYSSVAHMNFSILGLFCFNQQGLLGSLILMLSHGFISSALFFSIGIIYDRYHTRLLRYYGGLAIVLPIFTTFLFFFILGNISFPGTFNFMGEFLIIVGLVQYNPIIAILSFSGIMFSCVYSFFMFNRLVFGTFKFEFLFEKIKDLNKIEFFVLLPLLVLTLIFGVYTSSVSNLMHYNMFFFFEFFSFNLANDYFFYLINTFDIFSENSAFESSWLGKKSVDWDVPALPRAIRLYWWMIFVVFSGARFMWKTLKKEE